MYAWSARSCRAAGLLDARRVRSSSRSSRASALSERVVSASESPTISTSSALRPISICRALALSRCPTPICPSRSVSAQTGSSEKRSGGRPSSVSTTMVPSSPALAMARASSRGPNMDLPVLSMTMASSFPTSRVSTA